MKKFTLFTVLFAFASCLVVFSSCTKDADSSNWSPTQALPSDTHDDTTNVPNDTASIDTNAFVWQSLIIGDDAFQGDSSTFQYAYDAVSLLHIFSCYDSMGRVMTIRLPSLDPGEYTISFSNSAYISLEDNSVLFDTSFNPNGSVLITQNNNNRISAQFQSDLNDNGITGQVKSLVNGTLTNVPYQ